VKYQNHDCIRYDLMFCHKLNYCDRNKAIIKHLIENHNDNTVEVGAKILI